MRYQALLLASLFAVTVFACSGVSMIERENLTSIETREKFIQENPEGKYIDCIRHGEITRGMSTSEVMASWGMPDIYLASRNEPIEHWIFYIEDEDSRSVLVYTLTFDTDLLGNWDIDMKRFIEHRVVYDPEQPSESVTQSHLKAKKR